MAQIVGPILGKLAEYLAAPVGRQLGYVFCFSSNVETLKIEADKLNDFKVDIQRRVDNGRRNIEDIDQTVQKWLDDADAISDNTQNIIRDGAQFPKGCFNHWCLNLKSRYALSRRAKKKTTVIVELQKQGQTFGNVGCPAPPKPLLVAMSSSIALHSRDSKLNDIMKSLKNEEFRIVGICGMGGVGKTTMMEQVLKKAKEENLFDEYAKTVVSQKADSKKIQSDIAEMLGLKLQEQSQEVRAGRINERLQGKNILIILDDAWEEIDLQPLGIDLKGSHKRCKILYTSRIKGLWIEFGGKRCELGLDVLPDDEAWDLFKEKVGDFPYDKHEFVPVAKDIVKECGNLPLSLVTLGRALRGKNKHTWKDTLLKLRTVGPDQKVNESLKLSYDYLDNDEAKSLFLLCSLFQEDSKIDAQRLVYLGMGLRLFKGISSVAAARDRVFTLLEHLHSCYLISITEYFNDGIEYIKVHDVVRDVSKSIALTEKGALIFEHIDELKRSQEQGKFEDSRWVSVISEDIKELPTRLQFPKLELLIYDYYYNQQHLADNCFEGMVKLQVVDIYCDDTQKFPSSLQYCNSLRTLCLSNCRMEDLTAIGNLQSLEILRVVMDKSIKELPKEIGQLTNLMVLDFSYCPNLVKISPGVISSLTNLEELYILHSKVGWKTEGNEEETNGSLRELKALSKLHTLHIQIKDPRALPRTPLFGNLKKYSIVIGELSNDSYTAYSILRESEKSLMISLCIDVPLEKDFNYLLYNSGAVVLKGAFVKDMALKFLREGSQTSIKYLMIDSICEKGDSMDLTMASSLLCTLEKLTLSNMQCIQQIASTEEVDATSSKLNFPQLKELWIEDMPELVSFCLGIDEIQFPQLRHLSIKGLSKVNCIISSWSDESSSSDPEGSSIISLFPHKVSFPSLVNMYLIGMENMKEIWPGQLQAGSFCNLTELCIWKCNSLQYVFHPGMARNLMFLWSLRIQSCTSLKDVIEENEQEEYTTSVPFLPKLKRIVLDDLPSLEMFCHVVDDLEFPVLDDVVIVKCPKLKTFAPGFVDPPNLNYVKLDDNYKAKTVWKGNLNSTIKHLYADEEQRKQKHEDESESHDYEEDDDENEINEDEGDYVGQEDDDENEINEER